MERSPEVEQLAVAWLDGMKAGDPVAVASLFVESEATTVIGNGTDQWFTGDAYAKKRVDQNLGEHGGSPVAPGSPGGWAEGDPGGFASTGAVGFPGQTLPVRLAGVSLPQ